RLGPALQPLRPPVDALPLLPRRWRQLRRDPGVERALAAVGELHETGLAMGEEDLRLRKPVALGQEPLRPCRRRVIAGMPGPFAREGKLQRPVPAEVGNPSAG